MNLHLFTKWAGCHFLQKKTFLVKYIRWNSIRQCTYIEGFVSNYLKTHIYSQLKAANSVEKYKVKLLWPLGWTISIRDASHDLVTSNMTPSI